MRVYVPRGNVQHRHGGRTVNVDSILVSEYATKQGNLLSILNCFNRLSTPLSAIQVPSLAVSLIIHGHSGEAGTSHSGEIRFIDEDREPVRPPNTFSWTFAPREQMNPGVPLRYMHVWRIHGHTFERDGAYAFEVYIDDTYHAAASLYVSLNAQQ